MSFEYCVYVRRNYTQGNGKPTTDLPSLGRIRQTLVVIFKEEVKEEKEEEENQDEK